MPPRTVHKQHIHTDRQKYPDFVEIGKSGSRVHIAFNADDPEQALERVDNAFLVREYTVNEYMRIIEKEIKKGCQR